MLYLMLTRDYRNNNKKVLLTSFTILQDIVSNIVGEEFKVESITKPGMEVHGYKTTPSDLIRGSKAVLFLENGFGLELWSDKFVSNLDVKRVKISDNLKPIFIGEDVYKGKPNPHAWISPKRGTLYVDNIVKALKDLDPENSSKFEIIKGVGEHVHVSQNSEYNINAYSARLNFEHEKYNTKIITLFCI